MGDEPNDAQKPMRGAVLQFEIDRKRWQNASMIGVSDETPDRRLRHILLTAMMDTIKNGGTFVVVASPDAVTVVQRPDAADLES